MIPTPSKPRVLLVDDEPLVLQALSRLLHRHFETHTETSGAAALATIKASEPFAVIVSDMRMPQMDGSAFLKAARGIAPETVRVMLTGQADVAAAAACVNEGQIFRFLEKPCEAHILQLALTDAAKQYSLITSERVLLEQTLKGSISMLTDILALASPVAFSRAARLKRTVSALAELLNAEDVWQIEVAAMLSQLGAISLAPATIEKLNRGESLDEAEREQSAALPNIARQLIGQIPRLEAVCDILKYEEVWFDGRNSGSHVPRGTALPMGARLLKVAMAVDTLEASGMAIEEIMDTLRGRVGMYDPDVVAAFGQFRKVDDAVDQVIEVKLSDVAVGMTFAFDVCTESGMVLIGRGQDATESVVRRIQNHWQFLRLREPARVFSESMGGRRSAAFRASA
jgi:response regulator RpfG family c-di-GMP phosphodiesterase